MPIGSDTTIHPALHPSTPASKFICPFYYALGVQIQENIGMPGDRLNKQIIRRLGTIASAKGAKRELVRNAIAHLLPRFTIGELSRVCKGISRRTLVRALEDLRGEGKVRCLGRGPDAQWERVG